MPAQQQSKIQLRMQLRVQLRVQLRMLPRIQHLTLHPMKRIKPIPPIILQHNQVQLCYQQSLLPQ
jgi:hypothetical protein